MIMVLLNSILFLAGFLIMIRGADSFITYSGKLGRRLGMRPVIIGLTIVSMGTSFPELSISVIGAIKGSFEIGLGNIIGSNIANVGIFLGLSGFVSLLHVKKNILTTETPLMIFSLILLYFFMQNDGVISSVEGIILLLVFLFYLFYVFRTGLRKPHDPLVEEIVLETKSKRATFKLSLLTFGGLFGLLLGSYIIVDTGIEIARLFSVSESIIALTVMALGTSIPEVTSSLVALKKGEKEVAFGGIVGSITFNTLLIVGISSFLIPLNLSKAIIQDGLIMIFFGIMLLPFAVSGFKLTKFRSSIVLVLYLLWVLSTFI